MFVRFPYFACLFVCLFACLLAAMKQMTDGNNRPLALFTCDGFNH